MALTKTLIHQENNCAVYELNQLINCVSSMASTQWQYSSALLCMYVYWFHALGHICICLRKHRGALVVCSCLKADFSLCENFSANDHRAMATLLEKSPATGDCDADLRLSIYIRFMKGNTKTYNELSKHIVILILPLYN